MSRSHALALTVLLVVPLLAASWGANAGRPNRQYLDYVQKHRRAAPMLRNLPEGTVVETRTEHVALFPRGARIERRGRISLDPGEHRLVVTGLPHAMDDATLQISGFGDGVVAGTTFLEAGTLVEARPPDLVELEKALSALEEQEASLAGQEAALARRTEVLMASLTRGEGAASGFDGITRAMDFAQEELVRVNEKLATLAKERRELAPDILGLRADHQRLLAELQRPVKHVVIEVSASGAVDLPLTIRYFVPGPLWKPRHVARYDGQSGRLTLQTYAWVVQETGETWDAVTLAISGAEPSRGLLPPASREVGVSSAPEQDRIAGVAYGLRELADQSSGLASGAGRRFSLDEKVTIRSGPRGRRVLLETMTVPAFDLRVAVPSEESGVFLLLTFANTRITSLMPGEASLFNGPDYVGTVRLPAVPPGGDVALPFGRDPKVTVERKLSARSTETERRGSSVLYRWSYVVRSALEYPVQVEVRDQLPVSHDRKVKVTLEESTPAPERGGKGDPDGLLRWHLDVPAEGEQTWELLYSVRVPDGRRVVGLDLPAAMR